MADGHDVDPVALLMVVDALPPVTFDLGRARLGADPRAHRPRPGRPRAGVVEGLARTRNVAGGMFEEDCEVWDSAGRLVAQSRQLAMQPRA